MEIMDLLSPDAMLMDLKGKDANSVQDEMIAQLSKARIINDQKTYKADIIAREKETTTGIGGGIAIPHAKDESVQRAAVLFARSIKGVDYNALDGEPVHLFFMIAAPAGADAMHLQALASLSALLIDPELVSALLKADTPQAVLDLFAKAQAAKQAKDDQVNHTSSETTRPFVVAVTACPTGIAHTYMAEAALQDAAERLNVEIKVETNGSEGVKHRLTAEEIKRAKGVIIAADKKVERARFDGKHVIDRPVTDGIKMPEQLIQDTLAEKGSIYHSQEDGSESNPEDTGNSLWNRIYKDLMNGVSNMLPFVVGGGS